MVLYELTSTCFRRFAAQFCATFLIALSSACTYQFKANGSSVNGSVISGQDVEKIVNQKLPTEYHQITPDLPLGHAHCSPGLMILVNNAIGRCQLDIGMISLPIDVRMGKQNQIVYTVAMALFDMRRLDSYIHTNLLEEYGLRANVDCGEPRYQVLKPGSEERCKLSADPRAPKSIKYKVFENGRIFIYNPRGLSSLDAALMNPLVARHKKGENVITSGALVERVLLRTFTTIAASRVGNVKVHAVLCPKVMDLSGNNRGICHLVLSGAAPRVAVWISLSDWHFETIDVAFPKVLIEEAATKYYQELAHNNGFSATEVVHCSWPSILVVTPPASRDCILLDDKTKKYRLTVYFTDRSGNFSYYLWT